MKYFLASLSLHLFILLSFFSKENSEIKLKKIEPSIQVGLISRQSTPEVVKEVAKEELKEVITEVTPKNVPKSSTKKIEKIEKKPVPKPEIVSETRTPKNEPIFKEENIEISNTETVENSTSTSLEAVSNSSEFTFQGSDKIAKNQNISGLSYSLLKEVTPRYPLQARKIGFKNQVVIKTKFLVNYDGEVESIEILEGIQEFGFREEVIRALKTFRFTPVFYKEEKVKLYFYKDFIFQLNG